MSILFKELSFEVLPTRELHGPALTITKTHLRFSRSLVHAMNNPLFVKMLIDRKNNIFAVQECRETDENAHRFARIKGLQKETIACGKNLLLNSVLNLIPKDMRIGDRYRVLGEYDAEHKAMVFDLKTVTMVTWN